MNRCARLFRTMGGLLLLADMVVLFLPVLIISQDNYPTIRYSQFSFVKQLFKKEVTTEQIMVITIFILVPALLALIMGVIGVVGSNRQIVSGIGSIIILGLNVAFYFNIKVLEPERINTAQRYKKDFGLWVLLGLSVVAALCGIIGLIATPRRRKKQNEILEKESGVEKVLREQTVSKENFVVEKQNVRENVPSVDIPSIQEVTQPLEPRGVMIGLSGDYKGAEIPFHPGETLKLGRDVSNDLIFANAQRVSRYHCTLTWLPEEKKFQIVDKSSNGSFINGLEECLPQNIAIYLEPGTILDIGNEQNRFRLE